MKKFIFVMAAFLTMATAFTSCSKCSSHDSEEPTEADTKITQIIKTDNAHMDSIDSDYQYFETIYVFSGNVDTITSPDVVEVTNVYETVDKQKFQPTVYFAEHKLGKADSITWEVKEGSFWLEDYDLKNYEYDVTIEDAFKIIQLSNVKKPSSKYCVLRAQLGPKEANPQYIFGNDNTGMIFVDAVNGKVSTTNPVFGNAKRLTTLSR